jgi:hypothetical protein
MGTVPRADEADKHLFQKPSKNKAKAAIKAGNIRLLDPLVFSFPIAGTV